MTYDRQALKEELKRDEGVKSKVYKDSLGIATIGVGRNLQDKGLRGDEIEYLLEHDIADASRDVYAIIPEWESLSDARQRVLVNLAFNIGRTRLAKFVKLLAALQNGDYEEAANQLLESKWASQVGERATRLAQMMRSG